MHAEGIENSWKQSETVEYNCFPSCSTVFSHNYAKINLNYESKYQKTKNRIR